MKKRLFALVIMAVLLFSACSPDPALLEVQRRYASIGLEAVKTYFGQEMRLEDYSFVFATLDENNNYHTLSTPDMFDTADVIHIAANTRTIPRPQFVKILFTYDNVENRIIDLVIDSKAQTAVSVEDDRASMAVRAFLETYAELVPDAADYEIVDIDDTPHNLTTVTLQNGESIIRVGVNRFHFNVSSFDLNDYRPPLAA